MKISRINHLNQTISDRGLLYNSEWLYLSVNIWYNRVILWILKIRKLLQIARNFYIKPKKTCQWHHCNQFSWVRCNWLSAHSALVLYINWDTFKRKKKVKNILIHRRHVQAATKAIIGCFIDYEVAFLYMCYEQSKYFINKCSL